MSFKPKLNKPILYLIKVSIYVGIYISIREVIGSFYEGDRSLIAFILTMLLIVSYRGRLTALVQKVVDKSFYYTLYQLKKKAQFFDQELNATIEYDLLIDKFKTFLEETFSSGHYAIYLYKEHSFEYLNHADDRFAGNRNIEFLLNDKNSRLFRSPKQLYPIEKIWKDYPECRPLIKPHIKTKRYSYFLPLEGAKNITGFILFDQSIKHYTNVPEIKEFLLELFQKTADVLGNAQIHSKIKRKSLESELLLEIVKNISATLNLEDVLESIIENLSELVSYDAAAIFLTDKDKNVLYKSVARGYDESSRNLISLKMDEGISGWAIKTQQGTIIPDVSRNSQYYSARPQTQSQITVPIISREDAIGALTLESDELDHFTRADLELLTIFSGLAAVAIRNARLYEDSIKKQRLESDLLVASKVQKALLPKRVPTIEGLEIDVINLPSQIVGGDLYDVFRIDDHRQGIAIGDGSGKGAPGAILMAVAYAGFKSLFNEIHTVATIVALLNNLLAEVTTFSYYVTFFFGILDTSKNTLVYCNAGHNPPILLRKGQSVEYLDKGGTVLGFLPNQEYVQTSIEVHSGDYICCYTDGVTEIRNERGDEFGEERLIELLRENYGKSPREIRLSIVDAIKSFACDTEFQDDVTLLVVRRE